MEDVAKLVEKLRHFALYREPGGAAQDALMHEAAEALERMAEKPDYPHEEIAALRAEIEQIKTSHAELLAQTQRQDATIAVLRAENERLWIEGDRKEAEIERLKHLQRKAWETDEIKRLRAALEMIAGKRQCLDNLMSDKDIARAALLAENESIHREENEACARIADEYAASDDPMGRSSPPPSV